MSRSIRVAVPVASPPAPASLAIERVVTTFAVIALLAGMLVPVSAFAATRNWSLTRSPASVVGGAPASVQVTAANIGDDGGGEAVGCVIIAIPSSAFTVTNVVIDSVSDGDAWSASFSGDGTWWYATLYSNSGGGNRLHGVPSESVTATVTFADTGLDGTFNWTGNAFNKEDCTDDFFISRTVSVTIDGAVPDSPPIAGDDAYATTKNTPLVVPIEGVLTNDTDPDGDAISAVLASAPASGALALGGDGSFTYSPVAGFVGVDAFTYRATGGTLSSNLATVTISVTNSAPVAVDDAYSTVWNQLLTVAAPGFLGNDSDPDGDAVSASIVSGPSRGLLTAAADGSFQYIPSLLFVGTDSFVYQVTDGTATAQATVVITVANLSPSAVADGPYPAVEDTTVLVAAPGVLANDTDGDGDSLTATIVGGAAYGVVTLNADGSFAYQPDPDHHGPDSFTYRASDGVASSAVTTASLSVAAVQDAPVASPETYALAEDMTLTVTAPGLLANDTDADGDSLTATLAAAPARGVAVLGPDGALQYTPDPNFNGIDTFSYSVDDGIATDSSTVTLTISAVNDAPVATPDSAATGPATAVTVDVLLTDTDVDGDLLSVVAVGASPNGTVTIVANRLRFAPAPGFSGVTTFDYTASDGQATDVASVTVTVAAPPPTPAPTATPAPTIAPLVPSPPLTSDRLLPATAPTPSPTVIATETPAATAAATPAALAPTDSPPPNAAPPAEESPLALALLAAPELTTGEFGAAAASGFGDAFGGLGSGFGLAVSAYLLGIPGLLFMLAVGGQLLGAAAWVPAIRRQLAGIGIRRRDRSDSTARHGGG